MTAVAEVTEPGVYEIPSEAYHADVVPGGSLSSSGARKLLVPSCPALFKWERDNPRTSTRAFDMGHAAHEMVLGGGPEIVRCDFPDWRTDKAKAAAAEARARGAVPLLPDAYQTVQDMAVALLRNPVAAALFDAGAGTPEASLFTRDEQTGVMLRGRLDWLPNQSGTRLIVPDYKTAKSAEPAEFAKSAANYGYAQQAAWYLDLITALELGEEPAFVFVVQEKEPPYLVSVVQLDVVALRIGRLLNRRAIDTYAECIRTDVWPGYVTDVALVPLPAWYERRYEEDLAS